MTAVAEQRLTSKAFLLFGGLLIWAAHFMLVYSVNAVVCARGLQDLRVLGAGLIPFTVAIATLVALAAASRLLWVGSGWLGPLRGEPHDDRASAFLRQVSIALALLSMVAIFLTALPSFVVVPCG